MPNLSNTEVLAVLQAGGVPVVDQRVPGGRATPRLKMFVPDSDTDGVAFPLDNCTSVKNADQVDADGDDCGNHCDGDFDNSGLTVINDFNTFKACFGRTVGAPGGPTDDPYCYESDMDGSGAVVINDFNLFKAELGTASGPSGVSSAQPPACQP